MARTREERLAEKTVERQFLHELGSDFDFAPATSWAVLEAAQQVLLPFSENGEIREGQMRVGRRIIAHDNRPFHTISSASPVSLYSPCRQ
jgi:hypothetical protein